MKRVQLSSAQKRKLSNKKQENTLYLQSKTAKPTDFLTQVSRHDIPIPDHSQSPSSEGNTNASLVASESRYGDDGINEVSQAGSSGQSSSTCLTVPVNSRNASTIKVDSRCFTIHSGVEITAENESLVGHGDGGKMIQSAKAEVNKEKDPGVWLDFHADDVAYWRACGPCDCQHHNGSFGRS